MFKARECALQYNIITSSHGVEAPILEADMDANLTSLFTAAETWCTQRGEKLTPIRRDVLGLLLAQGTSMKAYDILSALQKQKPNAAPPTVYRALDFLVTLGLAHRLDSLNAFVACTDYSAPHHGVLLICEQCHGVTELPPTAWADAMHHDAHRHGFEIAGHELEIRGRCSACRTQNTQVMA